ncbi:MAG: NHL repeat-containing protein [Clostridia bacterium]|nr:NHL repeat-containing protein [Clostridia bacterium]
MIKRILPVTAALFIAASTCTASAISSSHNYQYDEDRASIPAPETFVAKDVIYGTDLGIGAFSSPSDIFVDAEDNVYVADTDNNRIVVLDSNLSFVKEINAISGVENTALSGPKGVFVKDGNIYICDTANSRVVAIRENGEVFRYIEGDGIVSVNEKFVFQPEKVVLDENDNILVSSSAIYQGILRFDEKDEFKNFFAPNQVEATFETFISSLLKKFFTDAMKEGITKQLPSPYSNIYLGPDNFIFATSENVAVGQDLKCINSAGANILNFASISSSNTVYGDHESAYRNNSFIDVHADKNGNMLVADRQTGKLFLYDEECNLMAVFGGIGDEKGRFGEISAIEKLGENYLILDKKKNSITVMEPTDYVKRLYIAMEHYRRGEYTESEGIWQELLMENSNLPLAYCSLGRSKYHIGEYKLAMDYLEEGGDTYFYSLALNEYRKEFVHDHFMLIVVGGVAAIVAVFYIIKWIRKKLSE